VQSWFDNSFAKCGEDYFSNYDFSVKDLAGTNGLYVNKYGSTVVKGLFEGGVPGIVES